MPLEREANKMWHNSVHWSVAKERGGMLGGQGRLGRGWSSGRCLGRLAGRDSSRCGKDVMGVRSQARVQQGGAGFSSGCTSVILQQQWALVEMGWCQSGHEQMAWDCSWWKATLWGAFALSSPSQPLCKAVCAGIVSVERFWTLSVGQPYQVCSGYWIWLLFNIQIAAPRRI